MAERTCVVVGAGVVGLAITRALARCAALEVSVVSPIYNYHLETIPYQCWSVNLSSVSS